MIASLAAAQLCAALAGCARSEPSRANVSAVDAGPPPAAADATGGADELALVSPIAPLVRVLGHPVLHVSAVHRGALWIAFAPTPVPDGGARPNVTVEIALQAASAPRPIASSGPYAVYTYGSNGGGDAEALAAKVGEALDKNRGRPVPAGLAAYDPTAAPPLW